ncbi:RNA polymerase sigma factor sigF, chloroplastic [Nymphaea colorata]|nr:RNA polymerase sigma factor sigF, chloroplastic [Nymphaea colorata]
MEAANRLCSQSFLTSSAYLKANHPALPCPTSVLLFHERTPLVVRAMSTTSTLCHFPASVLLQEQRDDTRHSLHIARDDRTSELKTMIDNEALALTNYSALDQYLKDFERQLLYGPVFWNITLSSSAEVLPVETGARMTDNDVCHNESTKKQQSFDAVTPWDVLTLAKQAVVASKEAASLLSDSRNLATDFEELHSPGLMREEFVDENCLEEITVRSNKHLERKAKRQKLPKKAKDLQAIPSQVPDKNRRVNLKSFDPEDPLRLFLSGPETTELLTAKEEEKHFSQVQDLMKLEELKQQLHLQSGRVPTLVEWAEAVGTSCHVLQSRLHLGMKSRDKMIYANLRLVVYIAKSYQGMGISLQDLLQAGSMGLIRSLEKFNPRCGCRFSTYAYWWIRQSIRRAIFQNSRTIRIPESVYGILKQIRDTRRLCIQEGHTPTNEELARRIGITVERLTEILMSTRKPTSLQQSTWMDQDVTFQEVTADPKVECPEVSINKQLMRRHIRNLLSILTPKERKIIRYRYGMDGGKCHSLSEVGETLGLSKERIRQVENRAIDKLRKCSESHGLAAYSHLLM